MKLIIVISSSFLAKDVNVMAKFKYLTNATNIAKTIIELKLKESKVVLDATLGNGNDLIFIVQTSENLDKIYGFDIQEEAIQATEKRLTELKIYNDNVKLVHDSHTNIAQYIDEKIDLAIFNLGYLPKANHEITTTAKTTLVAVQETMNLLNKNGIIIIAVYYGHNEGKAEKLALDDYLITLDQKKYTVSKFDFINQINHPPFLFIIERSNEE